MPDDKRDRYLRHAARWGPPVCMGLLVLVNLWIWSEGAEDRGRNLEIQAEATRTLESIYKGRVENERLLERVRYDLNVLNEMHPCVSPLTYGIAPVVPQMRGCKPWGTAGMWVCEDTATVGP